MFRIQRSLPILVVALTIASTACASGGYYRYPTGARTRAVDDRAYSRGYDEGRDRGEADARRNRSFDYRRHDVYRDADEGYRGGDRNAYRSLFRQGFAAGYDDGFRRYARSGSGYPGQRYPGNAAPNYPPNYPAPNYPVNRASPAAQNGYRDGYAQGRDDARDRDRYDPVRASRYREGDHDYNSRYGPREDYKRQYRTAFEQGYEQGYREVRR